jgi:predicted PurR-regulated permease PerM
MSLELADRCERRFDPGTCGAAMRQQRPSVDGPHPTTDWPPTGRISTIVLLAATLAGLYLCTLLALPFLPALTWALVLAVLFAPVHRPIETVLKSPNLAALVSVLVVAIMIVAPLAFVARRLVTEAANGTFMIQAQFEAGTWRQVLQEHPRLAEIDKWIEEQIDVAAIIRNVAAWLTNMAASFVRGSVVQLLGLLLTFYLLFYSLRDRRVAVTTLREFLPLSQSELDRLLARIVDTIHATVYGILAVAGIQGTLGGSMFWWLGLPAPLLWGFVMAVLSIVPVLGAFVVWIPTAVYLALDGDWTRASILAGWGALVVGHVDNILRPILVGDRLKLHPVPLFVSFLGGLSLFGAAGLVLGPMVVTTTLTLLDIWRLRKTDSPAQQ